MAWNVGGNNNQGGYQQSGYQQGGYQQSYQQPSGDEGREFSWDGDTITADGSDYILLPPGDYNFTIAKFDRTRSQGSDKMPPCNMAVVYFDIHSDQGDVQVRENYLLHSKFEWKLSQLFSSVGLKKKGAELGNIGAAFDKAKGCEGHLKIKHEDFNGRTSAKVGSYVFGFGKVSKGASAPTAPAIDEDSMPFEIE